MARLHIACRRAVVYLSSLGTRGPLGTLRPLEPFGELSVVY